MPDSPESKEELASRFARYSDQKQFKKAVDAAFGGCVKRHVFYPSGRRIYTIVGSNADEFVDPERRYCTCESYYYRVLSGKTGQCYHLLSFRMASESELVKEVRFDDEEYDTFMSLLAADILRSRQLGKS